MSEEVKTRPQCGHPVEVIVSDDEGTNYCGWCESLDQAKDFAHALELARCSGVVAHIISGGKPLRPTEFWRLYLAGVSGD